MIPRFTSKDVLTELENGKKKVEWAILNSLAIVGEQFVSDARNNVDISGAFPKGNYQDRTANLRSSIGYFVLNNGQIVAKNTKGTAEGEAAAMQVMQSVPKSGFQLIGVAGMEYAGYVENMGYNVISSQADTALVDLSKLLAKVAERFGKRGVDVDFGGVDLVGTSMILR